MNLILYSSSVKGLDVSQSTTSSENFELSFIFNIAKFFDEIFIISKNAISYEKKDTVSLLPIRNTKFFFNELKKIIKKYNIFKISNTVVLFFGYDYITLNNLKYICTGYDGILISFTFDTHKGSIEDKSFIKKILIDMYFKLGIKGMNDLDGIILFNEQAYYEFNLNIPSLVSRVGINENEISDLVYRRDSERFNIVYAGSLEEYNGVRLMIETMKRIKSDDIYLEIYGNGNLKEYVEVSSSICKKIKYRGVVSRREVEEAIKGSNLLLNLRDMNSVVCKYAFPSKTIEYMASGIPILTTRVINSSEFNESTFILEKYNSKELEKMINHIKSKPQLQKHKSENAKKFLLENNLWINVVSEVYDFITNLQINKYK